MYIREKLKFTYTVQKVRESLERSTDKEISENVRNFDAFPFKLNFKLALILILLTFYYAIEI